MFAGALAQRLWPSVAKAAGLMQGPEASGAQNLFAGVETLVTGSSVFTNFAHKTTYSKSSTSRAAPKISSRGGSRME
jgi:hypothetical protein